MTPANPRWWATVWLLIGTARQRARARRSAGNGPSGLLTFVTWAGAVVASILVGTGLFQTLQVAGVHRLELAGAVPVPESVYRRALLYQDRIDQLDRRIAKIPDMPWSAETKAALLKDARANLQLMERHGTALSSEFEARRWTKEYGGDPVQWNLRLQTAWQTTGITDLLRWSDLSSPPPSDRVSWGVLALLLLGWWCALALHGEGVDTDTQRRHHPMWEWQFSHPVAPGAVLAAEALAPAFANPLLMTAPLTLAVLVGALQQSFLSGVLALLPAVPLVLAAAVWSKALQTLVMLRAAPRSRGGWLLLLGGAGLVLLFAPVLLWRMPGVTRAMVDWLPGMIEQLPDLGVVLATGSALGWVRFAVLSLLLAGALSVLALLLMRFALARGLESGFGAAVTAAAPQAFGRRGGSGGWRGALRYKEWLWLRRDRTALLQMLLVPLLLAATQLFSLRDVLSGTGLTWNRLAGLGIGLGSYMLFLSAPRALLSEGAALGLMLTWPCSLDHVLRIKVRVILALVSATVWSGLLLAWLFLLPDDGWPLLGVALLWPLVGLSVAERAATLVRVRSNSGDIDPLPREAIWVAGLGMFTPAIALFTAQWSLLMIAVAFNWMVTAAVWQRFQHRLPYLFDPDSLPLLRPPTVLGGLVAVLAMLELGTVLSMLVAVGAGPDAGVFVQTLGRGIAAAAVCMVLVFRYASEGFGFAQLLRMHPSVAIAPLRACVVAILLGLALGLLAKVYLQLLAQVPWQGVRDSLEQASRYYADSPNAADAHAVMALCIAPWAEELLFRGVLFRAMQPQWGTLRAALLSTLFFTALHGWVGWLPVFALGMTSALLFARGRALVPCVLLHLVYNAVVVLG